MVRFTNNLISKDLFGSSVRSRPFGIRPLKAILCGVMYRPANFYDELPDLLDQWGVVQQLILPEVLITDIVSATVDTSRFVQQQVDFYCPPAKLIIEIDGGQHQGLTKAGDDARDEFFAALGTQTTRIQTRDWRERNDTFRRQIDAIKDRLSQKSSALKGYKEQYERLLNGGPSTDEVRTKLLPTAVLRFQVLVIELLMSGHLRLDDPEWRFCVTDADGLIDQFPEYGRFPVLALSDFGKWQAGRPTRLTVNNDTNRLIPVPAYTQLDASVGYSLTRFSVRAKVSNLLNVLNHHVYDDDSVNPIAPRMLSATVAYRW